MITEVTQKLILIKWRSKIVFMEDLGVDSIDLVDLSMTVEDVFEVEMPFDDEDLEKIKTVGDLVKYIEENK